MNLLWKKANCTIFGRYSEQPLRNVTYYNPINGICIKSSEIGAMFHSVTLFFASKIETMNIEKGLLTKAIKTNWILILKCFSIRKKKENPRNNNERIYLKSQRLQFNFNFLINRLNPQATAISRKKFIPCHAKRKKKHWQ